MCDRHSRPLGFGAVGSIDIMTAITLCDAYGLYREDFEYILEIESIVYPRIIAKTENAGRKNGQTIH